MWHILWCVRYTWFLCTLDEKSKSIFLKHSFNCICFVFVLRERCFMHYYIYVSNRNNDAAYSRKMHHFIWYEHSYKNKYFFFMMLVDITLGNAYICYKLDRHLSWNQHHQSKLFYDMPSTLTTRVCSHL